MTRAETTLTAEAAEEEASLGFFVLIRVIRGELGTPGSDNEESAYHQQQWCGDEHDLMALPSQSLCCLSYRVL